MVSKMEIGIYAVVVIAVALAVAFAASNFLPKSYGISVQFQQLSPQQVTYPYQIGNFRIIVNNTGSSAISSIIVATYINDKQLHSYTISDLGVHANVVLNLSYIYPANGTYSFQAIADPSDVLPIQDRASARSGFTVNVSAPESPNVYTSVPNANISSTESFTLFPGGLAQALFISQFFNVHQYNWLVGNNNATIKFFEAIVGYISSVNGAYTIYNDSTSSYVAWSQTIANQSTVYNAFAADLGVQTRNVTVSGKSVAYAKLDGNTSACELYDEGWTKLLEFTNSSTDTQTCASMLSDTYNATQQTAFVDALRKDQNISRYQSIFKYLNTTAGGSALIMENSSIAAFNLFQGQSGFFGSYIRRNAHPANLSSINSTCKGFVFSRNETSVCSNQVRGSSQLPSQFLLANSTEIARNYTATLYSLVNRTQYGFSAQVSGAYLVYYLNVSGSSLQWNSNIKSTCAFSKNIGCKVVSFNNINSTAVLNITNNLGSTIAVNKMGCFVPGFETNYTTNTTIASGASADVSTYCVGRIPGANFGQILNFNLTVAYTEFGNQQYATGGLNVSNTGV